MARAAHALPPLTADVRPGMKGFGRTVMKGTKVETFWAEVLGVLRNASPGLGREKPGFVAGMSGSPVYVEGKLPGAVAYGWAYGKEPIAGITPFCQMHGYVESCERRDLSGIGTVTHIEGSRVYGRGHPFMGLGSCEFPLMTGFIHTVYPRQTVSFKMGSPLRAVGVIN